jgi:GDP-mannose 6-dehydrogenase
VDISEEKVRMVNEGNCPIVEPKLPELVRAAVKRGRLRAVMEVEKDIVDMDLIFVCVGTPSLPNGAIDLGQIKKVAREIGTALKHTQSHPIICLRSTVVPGTSERLFVPLIEETSGKKSGGGFFFVYHPEFLRECKAIQDYDEPGRIIFGSNHKVAADNCDALYKHIQALRFIVPPAAAELLKYTDNAFHAVKITFANEIGQLTKSLGIDCQQLYEMFTADRNLNISLAYLRPGFAFGGSCLPKDLRALLYTARKRELDLPLMQSVLPSNELQKQRVFHMIYERRPKCVAFLGLSFKKGTDDLRNSPMVDLVKMCRAEGIEYRLLDNKVHPERLMGRNKTALEAELPYFAKSAVRGIEDLMECDLWVLGHKQGKVGLLRAAMDRGIVVIDLVRHEKLLGHENYVGIC